MILFPVSGDVTYRILFCSLSVFVAGPPRFSSDGAWSAVNQLGGLSGVTRTGNLNPEVDVNTTGTLALNHCA